MSNATQPIAPILNDHYLLPDNYNQLDTTHIFRARCKHCLSFISGSRRNTSNFANHIRRKHIQIFEAHIAKQSSSKTWKGLSEQYGKPLPLMPVKMEACNPLADSGVRFPENSDPFGFLFKDTREGIGEGIKQMESEEPSAGDRGIERDEKGVTEAEDKGGLSKVNEIALRLQKNKSVLNSENVLEPPTLTLGPHVHATSDPPPIQNYTLSQQAHPQSQLGQTQSLSGQPQSQHGMSGHPQSQEMREQSQQKESDQMASSYLRAKRCNEKQQEITKELVNFVNEHNLDASVVNSESSRRLLGALNPLYLIPDGDFLSRFSSK